MDKYEIARKASKPAADRFADRITASAPMEIIELHATGAANTAS